MDLTTVEKNLKERGFKVSAFATAKEAADYLNAQIDGESVSFGGSMTLSQMGLFESLGKHNKMFSHWNVPDGMNAAEVLKNASTCDNYLLSANGLAETGEIINIDGTGNRVSSSLYGHKRVWFVVGSNKIAPTYDEALWRARNIAAPKNAQRPRREDAVCRERRPLLRLQEPAAHLPRSCRAVGGHPQLRDRGRARRRAAWLLRKRDFAQKEGAPCAKSSFRFRWRSA